MKYLIVMLAILIAPVCQAAGEATYEFPNGATLIIDPQGGVVYASNGKANQIIFEKVLYFETSEGSFKTESELKLEARSHVIKKANLVSVITEKSWYLINDNGHLIHVGKTDNMLLENGLPTIKANYPLVSYAEHDYRLYVVPLNPTDQHKFLADIQVIRDDGNAVTLSNVIYNDKQLLPDAFTVQADRIIVRVPGQNQGGDYEIKLDNFHTEFKRYANIPGDLAKDASYRFIGIDYYKSVEPHVSYSTYQDLRKGPVAVSLRSALVRLKEQSKHELSYITLRTDEEVDLLSSLVRFAGDKEGYPSAPLIRFLPFEGEPSNELIQDLFDEFKIMKNLSNEVDYYLLVPAGVTQRVYWIDSTMTENIASALSGENGSAVPYRKPIIKNPALDNGFAALRSSQHFVVESLHKGKPLVRFEAPQNFLDDDFLDELQAFKESAKGVAFYISVPVSTNKQSVIHLIEADAFAHLNSILGECSSLFEEQ